jgi:hypothetical protein
VTSINSTAIPYDGRFQVTSMIPTVVVDNTLDPSPVAIATAVTGIGRASRQDLTRDYRTGRAAATVCTTDLSELCRKL